MGLTQLQKVRKRMIEQWTASDREDEPYLKWYLLVGGYNDLGGVPKTLLVPGCPAIWSVHDPENLLLPAQGDMASAPSADTASLATDDHPKTAFDALEPMIRAMRVTWGNMQWAEDYQILTNRTSLSLLLQAVFRKATESFKLVCIEIAGCMLLVPFDPQGDIDERVRQPDASLIKYRKGILDQNTNSSTSARGNKDHHRIIEYKLGDLRILLEYPVDAHVLAFEDVDDADTSEMLNADRVRDEWWTAVYEATQFSRYASRWPRTRSNAGMQVQRGGRMVPQNRCVDLVLGPGAGTEAEVMQIAGNLWLGRVVCLAEAQKGQEEDGMVKFSPPRVWQMRNHIKNWEKNHAANLKLFEKLMEKIFDIAKRRQGPSWLEYDVSSGTLVTDEPASAIPGADPQELLGKWDRIKRGY